MARILTDTETAELLAEAKPLPENWQARLKTLPKANQAYKHRELEITGAQGHPFRVILRQSDYSALDFSVILTFTDEDGTEYRLIRYNGRHASQHTNKWEKARGMENSAFRNRFHIHRATERYQLAGFAIDGFAEPTDEYGSFDAALNLFTMNHGFRKPQSPTGPLFDGNAGPEGRTG